MGSSPIGVTKIIFSMKKIVPNEETKLQIQERKYNIPVIGHFNDRSVRFNSIMEASEITGISHHLIFESAIGKIRKAKLTYWEFENGADWLKYKAQHIRHQRKYTKYMGFNG